MESSLSLISELDTDIIEALVCIQLSKVSCILEFYNQFRN